MNNINIKIPDNYRYTDDGIFISDLELPILDHWQLLDAIINKDLNSITQIIETNSKHILTHLYSTPNLSSDFLLHNNIIEKLEVYNGLECYYDYNINVNVLSIYLFNKYVLQAYPI